MRKQPCLALLACLVAGSLSACSYSAHETRAAFEPVTDSTAASKPLAVLPPESGAVVAVLESRLNGVYTQRIVLSDDSATAGENAVVVDVDQSSDRHPADLGKIPRPTQDAIAAELDAKFPGVDMQISRAWGHNEFGPFGYAVGKASGGATCFYAWQFAQGAVLRMISDPQAGPAAASMPAAPTSIRVRLCRRDLSETEMVNLMRALEVYPPGGGSPYHDTLYAGVGPAEGGDALQAAGAPGGFYTHTTHTAATPGHRYRAAKTTHRQAAHSRVPASARPSQGMASISPKPGSVIVPLPSGPAPAATSGVNPLLAPLQAAPPSRAVISNDDMPLPGAAPPSSGAPAAGRSPSSMPLPN